VLLGPVAEQPAGHPGERAWCLAGQAVPGLLAPAGDAHQHDRRERHYYGGGRDQHGGGYPDLIHVSSVSWF
jgi:hypothetical protein